MTNFISLIVGATIGAIIVIVKNKTGDNDKEQKLLAKQRELDTILAENDKLHNRNKEVERQVEDLLSKNKKLYNQYKEKDDSHDNLEDDLEDARNMIKKLRLQQDELQRQLKEYKVACENYEVEVKRLKQEN